jgi:hypothetical protein
MGKYVQDSPFFPGSEVIPPHPLVSLRRSVGPLRGMEFLSLVPRFLTTR